MILLKLVNIHILGLGEAWKKSELLAEKRKAEEERMKLAEERFTYQKRQEFLALIRNGFYCQELGVLSICIYCQACVLGDTRMLRRG